MGLSLSSKRRLVPSTAWRTCLHSVVFIFVVDAASQQPGRALGVGCVCTANEKLWCASKRRISMMVTVSCVQVTIMLPADANMMRICATSHTCVAFPFPHLTGRCAATSETTPHAPQQDKSSPLSQHPLRREQLFSLNLSAATKSTALSQVHL